MASSFTRLHLGHLKHQELRLQSYLQTQTLKTFLLRLVKETRPYMEFCCLGFLVILFEIPV